MRNPVGVAVVGCGYWGANYLRVFNELPGATLVAACDQRADRLQEVARRFPGVAVTPHLEEALAMEGVDVVVVATAATTHFAVTRACLDAGKHVLVEKPLTTESSDAAALGVLAEAKSLVLMVGHTFVYNSGIRKVKEYLDGGADQIYYLYARRTNLGPIRQDVNALWDLASHDISIFNYLVGGPPEWVSAVGVKVLRNCREDVGFVSLGYRNNIVGHIHVSWADPHKTREVVVVGSERRIVFDDMNGLEQVRVFEKGVRVAATEPAAFGDLQLYIRDGDILSPHLQPSEPLKSQCRHFLECVTEPHAPLTGAREGQYVVNALEAIHRSIALQGAPVRVERRAIPRRRHPERRQPVGTNGVLSHVPIERRIGLRVRTADRRSRITPDASWPRVVFNGEGRNEMISAGNGSGLPGAPPKSPALVPSLRQ